MATCFEKATDDQLATLRAIMEEHHPELVEAGVTVELLIARAEKDDDGKPKGRALSHGGYVALGIASINPYLLRVRGLADAMIRVDGDWLDDEADGGDEGDEFKALLDHELTHFQLKEGDERDRAGRPRLKIRRHDRQHGWFDQVARRWGPNSQEHQQARAMLEADLMRDYQLTLPGLKPVEPIEDKPKRAANG